MGQTNAATSKITVEVVVRVVKVVAGSKISVESLSLRRSGLGECLGRRHRLGSGSKVGVELLLLLLRCGRRSRGCWSVKEIVVESLLLREGFLFPSGLLERESRGWGQGSRASLRNWRRKAGESLLLLLLLWRVRSEIESLPLLLRWLLLEALRSELLL